MKYLAIFLLCSALVMLEPRLAARQPMLEKKSTKITATEFFLQFLGEFRYTLAAYLWLNTEIYHHELGLTWVDSTIGTGNPKKVGEILAICQLVTKLDPHFINAYDIGGWRLAKSLGKLREGIAFLKEGLSHNPGNPTLNEDLGEVYFFYAKNYHDAIPYLKASAEKTKDKNQKNMTLHMLGHSYEKDHNIEKAIQTYRQIIALSPNDIGMRNRINQLQKKLRHP